MPRFAATYRDYIESAKLADDYFGYDLKTLERIEPLLNFLFHEWWHVQLKGLEHLPSKGAAVIVGNSSGIVPWTALMLTYALMSDKKNPRPVHIVVDMDWIDDERVHEKLGELGFVPWSSSNLKRLIGKGELVAIFPEGLSAAGKPFSERYRLREFDWTRILPAVEEGVKIFPLATLGADESVPTLGNCQWMAKALGLPAFPVSPFFPWYPFPVNLVASLPVTWRMSLLKSASYTTSSASRDGLEDAAIAQARLLEGEIQAELNRQLRARANS